MLSRVDLSEVELSEEKELLEVKFSAVADLLTACFSLVYLPLSPACLVSVLSSFFLLASRCLCFPALAFAPTFLASLFCLALALGQHVHLPFRDSFFLHSFPNVHGPKSLAMANVCMSNLYPFYTVHTNPAV